MQPDRAGPTPDAPTRLADQLWRALGLSGGEDEHARGVRISLVAVAVQAALRIVVVIANARLVAPDDTGVFQAGLSIIVLVSALCDPGLSETVARRRALSRAGEATIVWINWALGALGAGAIYFGATALAALAGAPGSAEAIRVMAVLPLLAALFAGPISQMRRRRRYRALILIETGACAAGVVATIATGLLVGGWWALAAFQFAYFAIKAIACHVLEPTRPAALFRVRTVATTMAYSSAAWASRLLMQAASQVDKLIVGAVLGMAVLGVYSRAALLVGVPLTLMATAGAATLVPSYAALRGDPDNLSRFFVHTTRTLALLLFPAFFGMAALADPIVNLLFSSGTRWNWSGAAAIFAALAPGAALEAQLRQHSAVRFALGKPRAALATTGAHTGLVLTGALVGATTLGALGAAFGYGLANLVCFPVSVALAARETHTPLNRIIAAVAPPLVAAGAMALAVRGLARVCAQAGAGPAMQIVLLAPIGAALYGALLMVLLWAGAKRRAIWSASRKA